jgi:hypothetical protein
MGRIVVDRRESVGGREAAGVVGVIGRDFKVDWSVDELIALMERSNELEDG